MKFDKSYRLLIIISDCVTLIRYPYNNYICTYMSIIWCTYDTTLLIVILNSLIGPRFV